jgi:hypothetical protein
VPTTTEAPAPPPIELFVVGDSFAAQGGNPGRTSAGNLVISGLFGSTIHRDYRPLPATATPEAPLPTPDADSVADNGGWTALGLLTDALGERLGLDRIGATHHFGFNGSLAWAWAGGLPCAKPRSTTTSCPQAQLTVDRLRSELAAVPSDHLPLVVLSIGGNDLHNTNWTDPMSKSSADAVRQADFSVAGGAGQSSRTSRGYVTRWYRLQQIESSIRSLVETIRTASGDRAEVVLTGYAEADLDNSIYKPTGGTWYEWSPGFVSTVSCRSFVAQSVFIGNDYGQYLTYAKLGLPNWMWPASFKTAPTNVSDAEALLDDLFTGGWVPGATTWRRDSLHGVYSVLDEDYEWVSYTPLWNMGSTASSSHLLDCIHLRKDPMTQFMGGVLDGWLATHPEQTG